MNKISITLVAALLCISTLTFAGGQVRKVLVIGVDGCRSDALQQQITNGLAPNLGALAQNGFYTWDSWHCDITISGPSWSSIMCGVYHPKHGVTNNSYSGSVYNTYPYFVTLAKQIKPNLRAIEYCEWAPMVNDVYNDAWDNKIVGQDGISQTTGDAGITQLGDANIDLFFLYFDHVDLTGHANAFSPTNPVYMSAIHEVDSAIGRVIGALRNRPTYAQEDWLVLVTTDHGGIGSSHGGSTYQERNIWWIGNSDRAIHQHLAATPDPGTYNHANYTTVPVIDTALQHRAPVQADIAVTALHHLIYGSGIRPENQTAWALDGRSWLCEMGLCSNKVFSGINDLNSTLELSVFPNPTTGIVTVSRPADHTATTTVRVTNLVGATIYSNDNLFTANEAKIDLSNQAKGIYFLEVKEGTQTTTKKIVLE